MVIFHSYVKLPEGMVSISELPELQLWLQVVLLKKVEWSKFMIKIQTGIPIKTTAIIFMF